MSQDRQNRIERALAEELSARPGQIKAAVTLLDEGATVPFIARYRKEVTGGLDDTQLRSLSERLTYLRDLEDRRESILETISEQGKLTGELKQKILEADTKTRLEDLYLPYKPKRRTKAQTAREAGLEPLAKTLWQKPFLDPDREAQRYVNAQKGVKSKDEALEGAFHILVETFAEDADLVGQLREYLSKHGILRSRLVKGKSEEGARFEDYFEYHEKIKRIPSHRALALLRGQREGILRLDLIADNQALDDERAITRCEVSIARKHRIYDKGRPADTWLAKAVHACWKQKLHSQLKNEMFATLKDEAEQEAIRVFAKNLGDLLLAAPAGNKVTLGLDPGLRTGTKVAVVDGTGKVLDHTTIYPHPPQRQLEKSEATLVKLCKRHGVTLISIGNGTASRETDRFVAELIRRNSDLGLQKVMVSEAGASVYSASALAADELPDLDVTIRGAVSIARRLQDPLAELVKIEPRSIGVGQYQHDVNQGALTRVLGGVVEDCVNGVGVNLNTASAALLSHVSGLNKTLATNIVQWRNENGRFRNRKHLLKVPRLGARAFEQAGGFLRIRGGDNPLDGSAVHPEAYPVVERMARRNSCQVQELIQADHILKKMDPRDYTDDRFGLPTVKDIIAELEKPGRDPRGSFKTAHFREGVENLSDLEEGMFLEGVVSNVTNFGAFVDVGVHQDGLVHISELADHFVRDPHEVVKAGDVVKVHVLSVDIRRKRVSLSMKQL